MEEDSGFIGEGLEAEEMKTLKIHLLSYCRGRVPLASKLHHRKWLLAS
jgi:hypothetical protein